MRVLRVCVCVCTVTALFIIYETTYENDPLTYFKNYLRMNSFCDIRPLAGIENS